MRAVIIDSGLDEEVSRHYKFVDGLTVDFSSEDKIVFGTYVDEVGHGTAVTDVFASNVKGDYELFIIKIFGDSFQTTSEHLCVALEYINTYVECELILISSGIRVNDNYNRLYGVINKLVDKNVVIVSAFDNNGAMSYPAAFSNVIGVDVSRKINKKEHFVVRENSLINVIGCGSSFRLKWLNGKKTILRGSSFTAAYIAAIIMNYVIERAGKITFFQCIEELKGRALNTIYFQQSEKEVSARDFFGSVKKAIVFPFNKEIHSIAAFERLLSMTIVGYYDVRQSGMVGMKICEVVKHIDNQRIIDNYENIDWESDFDTVILGHTSQLSELLDADFAKLFIEKCMKFGKKLYSFDDIELLLNDVFDVSQFFIPSVKSSGLVECNRGKLFLSNKPVLGVFGTSSKQGKYTLQLMLREMFLKNGYKVSQLGTEPTGYLFGFDYVYPMGYNSSVYVAGNEAVATLNEMMNRCECQESDIIIVGCQSMTVPMVNYNLSYYNLPQTEFILGVQPDVVVLCVNPHDDFHYIERTINFIQGICKGKVIGFCMYPRKVTVDTLGNIRRNREMEEAEYELIKLKMEERWKLPVFCLNHNDEINKMYERIIKMFV